MTECHPHSEYTGIDTAVVRYLITYDRSFGYGHDQPDVGLNTPVIIKYPFWQMTAKNPDATYVCLNFTDAVCPDEIVEQSICLEGDADQMIKALI